MKLVNLTPHDLNLILNGDVAIRIPPSGTVVRVDVIRTQAGTVDVCGVVVPINVSAYGDVVGLPAPIKDTLYIVSALVAQVAGRADVVYPDDLVRDDRGCVVGARALAHY